MWEPTEVELNCLKHYANKCHKEAFEEAKMKAAPNDIITTRDMCPCGMHTGSYKTLLCTLLQKIRMH